MKRSLIYLFLGLVFLVFSCKKDELGPQVVSSNAAEAKRKVVILNEGSFGFGNSSLSQYNPKSKSVNHSIYEASNKIPLGDVGQSLLLNDGTLIVVMNNSGRIELLDTSNYSSITRIGGLVSPRYVLPIGENSIYVSDLYSNKISRINLQTNTVENEIIVDGWTEEMVIGNGKAFVTQPHGRELLVIDIESDSLLDSISLRLGAVSAVMDQHMHLWVLCDGGINEEYPALYKIDVINHEIIDQYEFSSKEEAPARLRISPSGQEIYFINKDVFKVATSSSSLMPELFIESNEQNFYGLGVDPFTGEVYIGDAVDFVQRGNVLRYDAEGELIDKFKAGVIPQNMLFL